MRDPRKLLHPDQLHEYQKRAAQTMQAIPFVANWSGMGTGKTGATLTAVEAMRAQGAGPVAIVAPKRVAEGTWQREAAKWSHLNHLPEQIRHITFDDLGLTHRWRTNWCDGLPVGAPAPKDVRTTEFADKKATRRHLLDLASRYPYATFSYDALVWIAAILEHRWPWKVDVADESTFLKGYDSLRFSAMRHVRPTFTNLIELAGRPRPNGISDLWAQVYLLDQGKRLGANITAFRNQFMTAGATNRNGQVVSYVPRAGAAERVEQLVKDCAFSLVARDWLELPEEVLVPVVVQLPPAVREVYDRTERTKLLNLGGNLVQDTAAGIKLLQIANGKVYDDQKLVHDLHDAKLDALEELVESLDGGVLLAYPFKPDIAAIRKRFGNKVARIDSKEQIAAWQRGQRKILAFHPAEGAHGLDGFQDACSAVVWYGPTNNLEHYLQFNGRIVRQGQQANRVVIHHLIAENTIDEDVFRLLATKEADENVLLKAMRLRVEARGMVPELYPDLSWLLG